MELQFGALRFCIEDGRVRLASIHGIPLADNCSLCEVQLAGGSRIRIWASR